jgi:hypothetical protein
MLLMRVACMGDGSALMADRYRGIWRARSAGKQ